MSAPSSTGASAQKPAQDTQISVNLRAAILTLHTDKAAAYGDAWKKRGERLSILTNIARKVDRLTDHADAAATRDETRIDTAVDLLVYVLKYRTWLADHDQSLGAHLFSATTITAPYSDGLDGFAWLLATLDLTPIDHSDGPPATAAIAAIACAFTNLEAAVAPVEPASVAIRDRHAVEIAHGAVDLIAALVQTEPEGTNVFLTTWGSRH